MRDAYVTCDEAAKAEAIRSLFEISAPFLAYEERRRVQVSIAKRSRGVDDVARAILFGQAVCED